jgi:hypothetical protein
MEILEWQHLSDLEMTIRAESGRKLENDENDKSDRPKKKAGRDR